MSNHDHTQRGLAILRWRLEGDKAEALRRALPRVGRCVVTVLFAVVVVAAVVPLWLVPQPPLQDLPQHLAAVRVLHSYDDPAYGFASYFTIDLLRTQYLAYYLACDLLSYVFDLPTANLVLVSLVLVALPYTVAMLMRALGRDPAFALLIVPLTYNAQLILGFLNFIAAIPLMFWGLALAARQRISFSRLRAAGLAALLLLTFCTHVVPFALLGLGIVLLALERAPKRMFALAGPLLPILPVMGYWLSYSPAGQSTASAAGLAGSSTQVMFRDIEPAIQQLPMWLTDVLAGDQDLWLLKLWLTLWVALAAVGFVFRERRAEASATHEQQAVCWRLLPLPLLAIFGYLYAPSGYAWIWPIAERFALLTALLAVCWLPRLASPQRWVALGLVLALSLGHIQVAQGALRGFAAEVGDIEGAIAAIPPRSRVAGLIFDRSSAHIRFSPFIHYAALYQVNRGGVVMFTFADFPQSPFRFREDERPPPVRPRWEWLPQLVQPSRDLSYYDYVLVRGGPGRIARQGRHFQEVFQAPPWRVYRRTKK